MSSQSCTHQPPLVPIRLPLSPFHPDQMLCLCNRFWEALPRCRIPRPVAEDLPFICPMDHIFNLQEMRPPAFGPPIREHSFFDNPRGPKSRPGEVVLVHTRATPPPTSSVVADAYLDVGPGLTDTQLREAVSRSPETASLRRVHVLDAVRIWSRFEADADENKFTERFLKALGTWERSPFKGHETVSYKDWFLRPLENRQTLL